VIIMTSFDESSRFEIPHDLQSAMIERRHDFHRHPELSHKETRTSREIRAALTGAGWELLDCPTPTGAVATL
jgi:metal-dependent amidase/aminoacylase/carboxypeptidase family protein